MTSKPYPIGLVGTVHYRAAIGRCAKGERAVLLREPDNPHDEDAIAVASARGETIGYIPRSCWLREAIVDEGKGATATIERVECAEAVAVVLAVALAEAPIAERAFRGA